MSKAFFPGSFDPLTRGHLDLVGRGLGLFDEVVIGVGVNSAKNPLFSADERVAMIRSVLLPSWKAVDVVPFAGLVVDAARRIQADCVLRGLRTVSDFETELCMAQTNRQMRPELDTVFLVPAPEFQFISSRWIREIAAGGGDVRPWVPDPIAALLAARLKP